MSIQKTINIFILNLLTNLPHNLFLQHLHKKARVYISALVIEHNNITN